jgi:hypothetical protein
MIAEASKIELPRLKIHQLDPSAALNEREPFAFPPVSITSPLNLASEVVDFLPFL